MKTTKELISPDLSNLTITRINESQLFIPQKEESQSSKDEILIAAIKAYVDLFVDKDVIFQATQENLESLLYAACLFPDLILKNFKANTSTNYTRYIKRHTTNLSELRINNVRIKATQLNQEEKVNLLNLLNPELKDEFCKRFNYNGLEKNTSESATQRNLIIEPKSQTMSDLQELRIRERTLVIELNQVRTEIESAEVNKASQIEQAKILVEEAKAQLAKLLKE
jgi:hypothetical protein